jgi:hypothetical protein
MLTNAVFVKRYIYNTYIGAGEIVGAFPAPPLNSLRRKSQAVFLLHTKAIRQVTVKLWREPTSLLNSHAARGATTSRSLARCMPHLNVSSKPVIR